MEPREKSFDLISTELSNLSDYFSNFVSELRALLRLSPDEQIGFPRDPKNLDELMGFNTVIKKLSEGNCTKILESEYISFSNVIKRVTDDIEILSSQPPVEVFSFYKPVLKSGKYIDFIAYKTKYQSFGKQFDSLVEKIKTLEENLSYRKSLKTSMFDCNFQLESRLSRNSKTLLKLYLHFKENHSGVEISNMITPLLRHVDEERLLGQVDF